MPAQQQQIVRLPVPHMSGISQIFRTEGLQIAEFASEVTVHIVQCNVM